MLSSSELNQIFKHKVDLLLNGLKIGNNFIASMEKLGFEFNKGRKGGAGPAGGRYFIFDNNSPVNVPIWGVDSNESYLVLEDAIKEDDNKSGFIYCKIHNEKTGEDYSDIRLIPSPNSYNNKINLDDTINKQIAVVHTTSVLSSTIDQTCKYWRDGKKCEFCGIELSLKNQATIKKKTAEQLIKAIKDAKEEGLAEHITLTSGTSDAIDKGAEYYIEVVSKIKKIYPNLPIHIQIEPVDDFSLLSRLKLSGVDTIGIHLEIIDDKLREKITPGKFIIPKTKFEETWLEAVKIFGFGQVSTFILVGCGEDLNEMKEFVDDISKIGVVPYIVPARSIIGTQFKRKPLSVEKLIDFYEFTGEILIKNGLNPIYSKAGCVKCSGCSAIIDSYIYVSSKKQKKQ